MKKEKEEIKEPSSPFWMATFSDMVTLMMVFFILILSYSTIELQKFKGAMSSLKGALGMMPEMGSTVPNRNLNIRQKLTTRLTGSTEKQAEELIKTIKEMNLENSIEVDITSTGVNIRVGSELLFESGRAQLKSRSFPVLKEIAKLLREDVMEIEVVGHTDNVPINTVKYPSNWELSSARAMSVIRYFHDVERIPAKKLAAKGHGEHRPLVPNSNARARARNRRVEIFIKHF